MAKDVKCNVSDCRYWDSKICKASAIEVSVDNGGMTAGNSRATQCHTFEINQ